MSSPIVSPPTLIIPTTQSARRGFLGKSLGGVLSAAAVALLSGSSAARAAVAAGGQMTEGDVQILQTALGSERQAIAAYGVGGGSGLLKPGTLKVAQTFAGHHREHAAALIKAIRDLGGSVADEPTAASYKFPVETLKTEADVLTFAAGLERGAISAYVGAIPLFKNSALASAAASILADEAMHWAVLRSALGLDPVPGAFFS